MRKTITARDGFVLTDGTTYGTVIHLATGVDASAFYEITYDEYEAIMTEDEPSENEAPAYQIFGAHKGAEKA